MVDKVKEVGLIGAVCKACAQQARAAEAARQKGLTLSDDAFVHVGLAGDVDQDHQIVTL